jgi:hypothetical protein
MERKIGEIFEYNGEWYQCVEGIGCYKCAFYDKNICIANNPHCTCRSDKKNVIFKKLEKVGEPYEYFIQGMGIIIVQEYILANASYIYDDNRHVVMMDCQNGRIAIEIKQNKEDMKEKKLNLKEFNLEEAKAGKPVCTRDGRKARIICFDRINGDYYKIVACVTAFDGDFEEVLFYGIDGYIVDSQNPKDEDLMMLPQKKEGWINIYKDFEDTVCCAYLTKEDALKNRSIEDGYITTIKIKWEE